MLRTNTLKKLIKSQGRSQVWLAKQSGIGYQQLKDMLRDRSACSKDQAKSIAKALGVALGDVWNAEL